MIRRLAVVAIFAAACAVALVVLTTGGHGYHLRVQVDDAAGLRANFLVKIAGTPVGKVEHVDLDANDRAVATLRIDDSAAPVGRDARAAIRASNLLGEKYVDLEPGDARHPAPSGFEIPHSRTTTSTDLDDILSVLDADTRSALAAFLVGQGRALGANGTAISAALRHLPPTLDQATQLVDGLARDNRALGTLVDRSDRILTAVTPQRPALGRMVDEAGAAFGALDGRSHALGHTVQQAPGAIRQLNSTLAELQRAAVPLAPAARGLQATAGPLTATLRALPPFTQAARPALRTARRVSRALSRLGRGAAPVISRLRPATADLRTFATALAPVTRVLDLGTPDVLGLMQGWARSIQNRDAAGHIFRVNAELGGDVLNKINGYIAHGSQRSHRSHHRTPAPTAATPHKPVLPSVPQQTQRPHRLPSVRLPQVPGVDTAPVQHTVDRLLDFLLGP